ncbi:TRAP transporter small permease subunit [Epibacterium sp. SM1979]|uniref:TRAP transporter small permease protein n=1 Tax=Tritonibacter litoralis TaxID=2662264 RepID=A0A843YJ13_9RHOB|nr:TRAP transporter small permease subunit [Tritonibacter litoralis]MQQ10811.1 TRAP transporter small permease subunit [Tritonibacter litoralis]
MQLEDENTDAAAIQTRNLGRVEKTLVKITDLFSGFMLLGLVGLLVLSILSRDVIRFPVPWLEEIATLITIYAVAFASIGAWSRGAHIAVELVPMAIKGVWHSRYALFLQILSIVFLMLAAWGAAEMMQRSANNRTTALSMSFSIYYGGLLLAFAGMVFTSLLRLVGEFFDKPKQEG